MQFRDYTIRGPAKPILSEPDVCALLGISESTLRRWVARGRFPRGLKAGKKLLWEALDVAAWIYLASRTDVGDEDDDDAHPKK